MTLIQPKRLRIEDEIQKSVIDTAVLYAGQCPALKRLYSIPNGGLRSKSEAARMNGMGVRAGMPDLHLPVGRCHDRGEIGHIHSLYIELKKPGGKLSDVQRTEIAALQQCGNCVQVCDSLDKAWAVLCWYLSPQWDDAGRAFREVCGRNVTLSRTGRFVDNGAGPGHIWFEGQTHEEAEDFLRFCRPETRA